MGNFYILVVTGDRTFPSIKIKTESAGRKNRYDRSYTSRNSIPKAPIGYRGFFIIRLLSVVN